MAKYLTIGIDEVGRGCLAGPVTVGAVLKNGRVNLRGIKDSKKLSAKQREEWIPKLKNLKIAISSVGAPIIDKIGISRAATLAVGRCLRKLNSKHEFRNSNSCPSGRRVGFQILLDGSLYAPKTYLNQTTIVRGDEKIPIIAAASIVAKVHRDKKMERLDEKFPEYGLAVHKGYGTKLHQRAIKKHGLSLLHRRSFCASIIS